MTKEETKRKLVDFLIWIDRTDRNSQVENGQLTGLVNEYLSQLKPQEGEREKEKYLNDLIHELIDIYEHPLDSNKKWKKTIIEIAKDKGCGYLSSNH